MCRVSGICSHAHVSRCVFQQWICKGTINTSDSGMKHGLGKFWRFNVTCPLDNGEAVPEDLCNQVRLLLLLRSEKPGTYFWAVCSVMCMPLYFCPIFLLELSQDWLKTLSRPHAEWNLTKEKSAHVQLMLFNKEEIVCYLMNLRHILTLLFWFSLSLLQCLTGIVHPKVLSFTHLHVIPNLYDFCG